MSTGQQLTDPRESNDQLFCMPLWTTAWPIARTYSSVLGRADMGLRFCTAAHAVLNSAGVAGTALVSHQCFVH